MEKQSDKNSEKENNVVLLLIESLNSKSHQLSPIEYFFAGMKFGISGSILEDREDFIETLIRYKE
jgi:hypothetical protein